VIHIRHGKGDKERDVSIVWRFAIEALKRWQQLQAASSWKRRYRVLPALKGDKPSAE